MNLGSFVALKLSRISHVARLGATGAEEALVGGCEGAAEGGWMAFEDDEDNPSVFGEPTILSSNRSSNPFEVRGEDGFGMFR